VTVAEVFNILSKVSKQEDVVLANLASDFNLDLVSGEPKKRADIYLRWHHRKYQ
jgi:hypothetical protein